MGIYFVFEHTLSNDRFIEEIEFRERNYVVLRLKTYGSMQWSMQDRWIEVDYKTKPFFSYLINSPRNTLKQNREDAVRELGRAYAKMIKIPGSEYFRYQR